MSLALVVRRSLVAIACLPASLLAQQRPLTPADWDHWRSISGTTLSPDGRWAMYSLVPQVGDGELVVRATEGATERRLARGFVGRPVIVPGARPDTSIAPGAFSADSRFAAVLTYAPMADFERARKARKRPPVAALAILRLDDGDVVTVPRVRSFRMPTERGGWMAYLLEPDSAAPRRDSAAGGAVRSAATPGGQPRPVADSAASRREYGSTLVVRELATGRETRIPDVVAYAFDDSARWLGYTVSSHTPERDGAYVRELASDATAALAEGDGQYKQLVFDRGGSQIAFVTDRDDGKRERYSLYTARLVPGRAPAVARASTGGATAVSPNGRVAFTRDGRAVLFGAAPPAIDSVPADSLADRAIVDIWNYRDARLQPQQKLDAARDRRRSFESIYFLDAHHAVQLGNDTMPRVNVSNDGRIAMVASDERYAVERMWGGEGNDVYAIDAATGAAKLIRAHASGNASLSPDGKYIAYFDRGHWYAYGTATGRTVDLTAPIAGVRFDQETWDTPSTPEAWGIAGWTRGDESLLLYDRYDVWQVDPSGRTAARVVTDSLGRRSHLALRVVDLDRDDPAIDPRQPLLLRAFDDSTKASGFWRTMLGSSGAPTRIVMADVAFGTPIKARHAERYVVTRGTFVDFPDLYAGASLASVARISDANPQQKEFAWGSVELVHWTSADGLPLQGLLYKPAGFDSTKKYPMIAYFYEKLSQNLHQYVAPGGRNVINPTHYASNGYLVFEPDIAYEPGYPGPSAVKSVVPGVEALLSRGFVDRNALGIQGQSWGGYQTAFIITQTHLFRAAMAGAPVANMTSAYGGIRWGSGLARAFQYEAGQSRIGGSIWQYPNRYLENSPLFWLDKVTTPLLVMSNDADDAVPWYQGIELFVGLRRLGKEVYLLDYNNDVHNPTKRANQKDVALRMQQFFDHHLRGAPAPDWMTKGIPFLARGIDEMGPAKQASAPASAGATSP